jgi:hypothetical protein
LLHGYRITTRGGGDVIAPSGDLHGAVKALDGRLAQLQQGRKSAAICIAENLRNGATCSVFLTTATGQPGGFLDGSE